MAAIGKIRQHYGILVIIIGLALLAFVLGDLFKSTNKRRQTDVAVVNGEKITYQDFTNRAEQNIQYQKRMYGNLSNDQAFSVRQQTLDQMIREIIMEDQYKALGLGVSKDELTDNFIGEKPNQYVLNSFKDKDGNFDRDALISYINDVENGTYGPETREQWNNFVNAIEEDVMNTKYESLLKHAFYLPKKLADRYNDNKNLKRNAEVYAVRYTSIPDSTVVVTDQDNKKYYDTYKTKYATDAMRGIDYVVFDVKPSEADRASAKTFVENRKADFAQVENVAGYVANNSDSMIDEEWHKTTDYNADLEKAIVDHEVGFVYGPYEENEAFNIARIMGKEMRNDTLWAQVAVVSRDITVSTVTDQAIFAEVNKFVTENRTYDQFNAAIEAQGLTKRSQPRLNASTYQITGIDNPRQIVRWAFDDKTKKGDVSSIFELDNMFVVAALTDVIPEGYAPLEKVLEQSKYQILNLKKGEAAVEKMKACGNDYDRMVKELGAEEASVSDVNIESRVLSNFGVEADIVGTIMGMKEGEVVGPIAGNSSAFIIKNVKVQPAEATTDYSNILREKTAQFNNKVLNNSVYNALRNNVKIEDNRARFY